jgi:flavin reductase (DIM6/NTAB) family NADH-FMN oxidoreductase RutF/rubredoxin
MDKDRPTGCVANSIMQVTSQPATVAASINHYNYTNKSVKESGKFSVSILSEKNDQGLIGTFGFQSGRENDKYEDVASEMKDGVPIVTKACGWFTCKVIEMFETSTHTIFLGEVTDGDVLNDETPMTYAYYHNVIKGKSPKNAPTYLPDEQDGSSEGDEPEDDRKDDQAKWVCSVCGYVYDGDVPFEELPDDWKCPICKQPKDVFEKRS